MKSDFESKFESFLSGCARIAREHRLQTHPTHPDDTFIAEHGKDFIRIVRIKALGGRFAHCFVDRDGNVLRASNWSSRVKHSSGSIFDTQNGLGQMTESGPIHVRKTSHVTIAKIA